MNTYLVAGNLVVRMPKLNYIQIPVSKKDTDTVNEIKEEETKKTQMLEVSTEKTRNEMDFSKICETDDLPPNLEPVDWNYLDSKEV